jgi:hypothetical protein
LHNTFSQRQLAFVVVMLFHIFVGRNRISTYTMHTRRGCSPVVYQAVLFSSTTQCNLLPSEVYKNYTTKHSLLSQIVWLAGIDKSSMYMHQKRIHTSDLPSSAVFLYCSI